MKSDTSRIIHLRSATSTNDYLRSLALQGAARGTAVRADVQTQGRGRSGTSWLSPNGGLWMSIILRPSEDQGRLNLLPAFMSLAVTNLLREFGITGQVAWPNDIMVDGRKIAGIMCESLVQGERTEWVIVGIGINVNNPSPRLQADGSKYAATSMIQITGQKADLALMSLSLKDSVMRVCDRLEREGVIPLLREYNGQHSLKDRKIRVILPEGPIRGMAGEMDTEGKLKVELNDGTYRAIQSEEVLRLEVM